MCHMCTTAWRKALFLLKLLALQLLVSCYWRYVWEPGDGVCTVGHFLFSSLLCRPKVSILLSFSSLIVSHGLKTVFTFIKAYINNPIPFTPEELWDVLFTTAGNPDWLQSQPWEHRSCRTRRQAAPGLATTAAMLSPQAARTGAHTILHHTQPLRCL